MRLTNRFAYTALATFAVMAPAFPANAQLVAWWKLDETSGVTAHDQTGNFNGTLAGGAHFVSGGISGNALSLNSGTGDLVNMGTAFPGFNGADFTLVTWVNTNVTGHSVIAGKHETGTPDGYFNALNAGSGYGTQNKAYSYNGGAPANSPISTTSVNDSVWHQVVGVRNGGTALVYVDGTLEGTASAASSPTNGAAFMIGGVNVSGVPTAAYTGLVDDVQVYGSALSAGNINTLYHNPGTAIGFGTPSTPEPGTLAFASAIGVSCLGFVRRRRGVRA